jgi:hypothetical protein
MNYFILLFNFLFFLAPKHDFHVSKCLVEYNEAEQALQISLHVFVDDLEEALRQQGHDNLQIGTSKEAEQAEVYLGEYLKKNFRLELNGRPIQAALLGKELSDDYMAVWCYLEITGVTSVRQLKLTNTILMDIFDDQTNMVTVKGPGGKRSGFLFQIGNSEGTVSF